MHFPQPYYLSCVHWQSYCISYIKPYCGCPPVSHRNQNILIALQQYWTGDLCVCVCVCGHRLWWHDTVCAHPLLHAWDDHSSVIGACIVSVSMSLIALALHQHKDLMNERIVCTGINNTRKSCGFETKDTWVLIHPDLSSQRPHNLLKLCSIRLLHIPEIHHYRHRLICRHTDNL